MSVNFEIHEHLTFVHEAVDEDKKNQKKNQILTRRRPEGSADFFNIRNRIT